MRPKPRIKNILTQSQESDVKSKEKYSGSKVDQGIHES